MSARPITSTNTRELLMKTLTFVLLATWSSASGCSPNDGVPADGSTFDPADGSTFDPADSSIFDGRVTGGAEACSAENPAGTCPDDETCEDGTCVTGDALPAPVLYGVCDGFAVCAGNDQFVEVNTWTTLYGSSIAASSFSWSVVQTPAGGSVQLSSPSEAETRASFDLPGLYVLELTAGMDSDTVVVRAHDPTLDFDPCAEQSDCGSVGTFTQDVGGEYAYRDAAGEYHVCDEACRIARARVEEDGVYQLGYVWFDDWYEDRIASTWEGLEYCPHKTTACPSYLFWEEAYHSGGNVTARGEITERLTVIEGGDGISTRHGVDEFFTVRDLYIYHSGDDAIENDFRAGGLIDDVVIDGAMVGIAIRARSSYRDVDGSANTVTVRHSLISLVPQFAVFAQNLVPGHANFIKWEGRELEKQQRVVLHDNVFFAGQGHWSGELNLDGPRLDLVNSTNNLVIWVGEADTDEEAREHIRLPPTAGFVVTRDPSIFLAARADWFHRHPYIQPLSTAR